MCGIGGVYPRAGEVVPLRGFLEAMTTVQRHRGPDARGTWIADHDAIGLCHNRLAIIDLSEAGNQPMHSSDERYAVVFNGEVYNHRDLRGELEKTGSVFRTHTDTEVLLEAYRQWGEEMLPRLRGMFAFGIYDRDTRRLFCARDRIGKKPLVYAQTPAAFVFASEIPAVIKVQGVDTTLDGEALAAMMLHNLRHIPDPCTVYRGVRRLRAGHAMTVRDGAIERMWRYWSPQVNPIESAQDLRRVLEASVAVRSVADVPVGALLSGGIDSTAIVNLMQQASSDPVRTYAFGADADDEDLRRARFVARRLGTRHKEFYFDATRQFEILKGLLATYGEPIMLLPLIHAYVLSEAIRKDGIKVVLNGNGADELFYGYTGHLQTASVTRILNLLHWLRPLLKGLGPRAVAPLFEAPGRRKAAMYRLKAMACWPKILRNDAIERLRNVVSDEMEEWGGLLPNRDFIDESNYLALLIENTHSLTIASDLPAMMASVEMRAPFLDQEVVSAAMGIHFSKKVKGKPDGSGLKHILREAVRDLIPPELFHAPKRGFGMGIQERDLILGKWRGYAEAVFDDFPEMDVFDRDKVRGLWGMARDSGRGDWSLISRLFAVGVWNSSR